MPTLSDAAATATTTSSTASSSRLLPAQHARHDRRADRECEAPLGVVKFMMLATASLSAAALSCVLLQHELLLPTVDHISSSSSSSPSSFSSSLSPTGFPTPPDLSSPPPPPPPQRLSAEAQQEAFLEVVKRRASIETPLDTSFWRPYVKPQQPADHSKPLSDSQRQLVFVAGAEGTGHHFITALMMRLPELMPMSLVQEQVFQSLWWDPKHHDPATFWAALEAFAEWVRQARSHHKHPAFCARTCFRISRQRHCSWISGMQQQLAGQLLDGRSNNGSFQPVGQMFSYPFSRSSNETEDGTHYPDLADIVYMCDLLGVRLKVIVLYRDPIDAIMSMNNRGLPKIWRRAGRTFKLHKQVESRLASLMTSDDLPDDL
jgi:hypothetical protein